MARAVGSSLQTIQRIQEAHRLQRHRIRTFKRSNDPAFVAKVEDVVGFDMDPPVPAVAVSISPLMRKARSRRATAPSPACR